MISFSVFQSIKRLLSESTNKTAVISFGRMNPPSKGHLELMKDMVSFAKKNDAKAFLFLSHSQDKKKNPLDYETKYNIIKKYAPKELNVYKSDAKTIFDAIKVVVKLGAEKIIVVIGEDRKEDFEKLNKYKESLNVKEFDFYSGKRTEGVSGTALRNFALNNEYEKFKNVIICGQNEKDTRMIFDKIRDVMK